MFFQKEPKTMGYIWSIVLPLLLPCPLAEGVESSSMWSCNACTWSWRCPKTLAYLRIFSKSFWREEHPLFLRRKIKETQQKDGKYIQTSIHPSNNLHFSAHKLQKLSPYFKKNIPYRKKSRFKELSSLLLRKCLIFFTQFKHLLGPPSDHVSPNRPGSPWVQHAKEIPMQWPPFWDNNQGCLGGSCPTFLGGKFCKPSPWPRGCQKWWFENPPRFFLTLIYGTYLANPAENLGASKWIAVVTAGVCLSGFLFFPPKSRAKSSTHKIWDILRWKKRWIQWIRKKNNKHSTYFVRCDEHVHYRTKKWTKLYPDVGAVDFFSKGFLCWKKQPAFLWLPTARQLDRNWCRIRYFNIPKLSKKKTPWSETLLPGSGWLTSRLFSW